MRLRRLQRNILLTWKGKKEGIKMNKKDFSELVVKKILEEIEGIWGTKGEAYAPDNSDRLSNFKEVGKQLGLDPIQVWAVYFSKHRIAIESFIRRGMKDL